MTAKPVVKPTIKEQVDQAKAKKAAAELELAKMYAKAATDPVASRVLADISGQLADPDFECQGIASRSDGFMARYRAAQRIDIMIRLGRTGQTT
jgi:hypothetical protein